MLHRMMTACVETVYGWLMHRPTGGGAQHTRLHSVKKLTAQTWNGVSTSMTYRTYNQGSAVDSTECVNRGTDAIESRTYTSETKTDLIRPPFMWKGWLPLCYMYMPRWLTAVQTATCAAPVYIAAWTAPLFACALTWQGQCSATVQSLKHKTYCTAVDKVCTANAAGSGNFMTAKASWTCCLENPNMFSCRNSCLPSQLPSPNAALKAALRWAHPACR